MKNDMLNVLVVIYNIDVLDSETVRSLLSFDFKENIKLTIWNNGPETVVEPDLKDFNSISYFESTNNISLAKIYNEFLSNCCGDGGALILDHDTILNENDVLRLVNYKGDYQCVIPEVYCGKNKIYPIVRPGICMSIASGIFLSKTYYTKNSRIFDERFHIYGVDTSFYIRCKNKKVSIDIQGRIDHSLSRLEVSSEELKYGDFRITERSYDAVLMFRLYPSIRNLVRMLRCIYKNHRYLSNKRRLLLSFIKGKHLGISK